MTEDGILSALQTKTKIGLVGIHWRTAYDHVCFAAHANSADGVFQGRHLTFNDAGDRAQGRFEAKGESTGGESEERIAPTQRISQVYHHSLYSATRSY